MPENTTIHEQGIALVELGLLSREQLAEAVAGLQIPSIDALLRHLERRSLLTAFQIEKFKKGERTGYILGRFKLLYLISAGTFGRVFRGVDIGSGEVVAVKVLRSRHMSDPKNVQVFYREAKLIGALVHPNVTHMLEVGYDPDSQQHYIAMEFVEGGNLREFLRARKRLDAGETIRLGCEMVEGLRYALSRGVTHRDIKPTNILISSLGQVKWVDFGLGGVVEEKGSKSRDAEQRTVDYAGLEKATGAAPGDPRSDVFFLGTVFYLLLTGEPVMPETKDKLRRMHRRFDQIPRLEQRSEVPRELAVVVDRMLAFRPENRYQTYDTLLADLHLLQQRGVGATNGRKPSDGPPRVVVIHKVPKIQEVLRDKLSRHGYQVAVMTDIDRALSVHELKPAQCMIIDLDTAGRQAVEAATKPGGGLGRALAGGCAAIFLASEEQKAWTDGLESEKVVTLCKPLTLGPVFRNLLQLAPPLRAAKDQPGGSAPQPASGSAD